MIHALFLASGATGLVYQVAWARDLTLIFGASFEAQSIVLASFMAGLALGGFTFGRRADQIARPLRLYGWLEIGVAGAALVLPLLLTAIDAAYLGIAARIRPDDPWLNAARVAMAMGVLVIPTFCMGGTLPVLVRYHATRGGALGERLSTLYAINTFGAVVGTLTAGFVLLPKLGVWHTEALAALANVAIGVLAIGLDRRPAAGREPAPAGPITSSDAAPLAQATGAAAWPFRLAFLGTAVAGMGSFALEVSWSRAIALSTGANTYSFTVMLATFLTGIAVGSWLYERTATSRISVPVRLGLVLAGIGLTSALASFLIPRLPEFALRLALPLHGGPVGIRAETTFLLGFLVMVAPCVLMGIAFPLAAEARSRLDLRFGRSVGDLVGLNTSGAIVGSLLAGFVGIPRLGLQNTMLLAAAAYLGYGLLVLAAAFAAEAPIRRRWAWAGGVAALPAAVVLALALPRWNMHAFAGLPNNELSMLLGPDGRLDFEAALERTQLLYLKEGRGSTISVIGNDRYRSVLVNGRVVATDVFADLQHLYLLGHLPALLHPDPRSAVVIGLGAGLTLGGIAAHESVERIVVVDIEPAVRDAAQLFADLHDDALADPRVEVVWQDGRNYMKTTRERFDVITADPIDPAQGGASLYTSNYYKILADHLTPNGVACQWLGLYELSDADLRSVVAAFAASFPHVTLWQAAGDALLIGSNASIAIDFDQFAARLRQPRVARQLSRVGLEEPLSLLAEFGMDQTAVERFTEGAIVNSDDNLYLEFSSPRAAGSANVNNMLLVRTERAEFGPLLRSTGGHDRRELEARLAKLRDAKSMLIQAAPAIEGKGITLESSRALIAAYRRALEQAPGYRHAEVLLADALATLGELHFDDGDSAAASRLFHEALELDVGNAVANLYVGLEWSQRSEPDRALAHFQTALERRPRSVNAQAAAGQTLMGLDRHAEALEHLRVAEALRPDIAEVKRLACACLRELGELEAALAKCREADRLAPNQIPIALELATTLQRSERSSEAIETLRRALTHDASGLPVRLELAWMLSTSPDPTARDGAEALRLVGADARRSQNPRILDVMAAALAESGRFDEAAGAAAQAAQLAEVRGHADLARQIRAREAGYRAARPMRSVQ